MRNFIFPGLVFSALLMITSGCGPKEFNLSTQTPKKMFSEVAQSDSIIISGSDGTCEIEYSPDWMNAEVTDSVVYITMKANDTGKIRKDVVVVKCGASNISIDVEQGIKATHLELPNGDEIKLGKEGGSQELVVVTDGSVKVEGFDGIEAAYDGGKLTVSAPKNDGNRFSGVVKLTAGEFSKEVKVCVDGKVCTTCNGAGTIKCKACSGKGYTFKFDPSPGIYGCHACGGRGYSYRVPEPGYRDGKGKVTCPTCKGKGV